MSDTLQHKLLCCSGGMLDNDCEMSSYLGAQHHNSFTTEVAAGLFARMWALQAPVWVRTKRIVVLYDSSSAANVVAGRQHSQSNNSLCKCSNALHRLLSLECDIIDWHVKSHDFHPWNELADSLCDFYAKRPIESLVRMTPISPLSDFKAYAIDIAAAMCSPLLESQLVSPVFDSTTQTGIGASQIATAIDTHGRDTKRDTNTNSKDVSLHDFNVVQYNVQTFSDADDRKDVMTRLKHNRISIACFQEAQGKFNGIKSINGFLCCQAAGKMVIMGVKSLSTKHALCTRSGPRATR